MGLQGKGRRLSLYPYTYPSWASSLSPLPEFRPSLPLISPVSVFGFWVSGDKGEPSVRPCFIPLSESESERGP
jgi:hypothetical protein